MERAVFYSKLDIWLAIVLLATVGILFWAVFSYVRGLNEFTWGAVIHAGGQVMMAALVISMLTNTRYVVGESALIVWSGPIRWSLPYSASLTYRETKTVFAAPALSMDRLEVHMGDRGIVISPADKEGFLRALIDAHKAYQQETANDANRS